MRNRLLQLLVGTLLVGAYYAGLPDHAWAPAPAFSVPQDVDVAPAPGDDWQLFSASDAATRLVHAASMVELPDGRLRAFWFAGSREGAVDVAIHSAVFDPVSGVWSPERPVIQREQVEAALGRNIRKLGNAVPVRDGDLLRLYFVAVSMGGWGGSRLAVAESADLGGSWQVTGTLVTSPFLNISTLVKGAPVRFADGSLGLPVYHEFLGKFGELLRLSPEQRVLEKQRIGHARESIQPVLFIQSPTEATALLRNESESRPGGLFESHTEDRGDHWSALAHSGLPNPGSAVGGVSLGPLHWLVGANHNPHERDSLAVLESRDAGGDWQLVKLLHDRAPHGNQPVSRERYLRLIAGELADFRQAPPRQAVLDRAEANKCRGEGCTFQFDYPYLLRAANGDIHLLYTWNKTLVGHAWWRAEEND